MPAVLTPRLHNRERIPGKHSHLCPPNLQDRSPGMGKSPLFNFDEFPSEQHLHGKSMANSGIPIATFDDTRGFLNQLQSLDDLNERDSESSCSALAPRKVALEHPNMMIFLPASLGVKNPGKPPCQREGLSTSMCVGSTCSCIKCSAEKVAAAVEDTWSNSGASVTQVTHATPLLFAVGIIGRFPLSIVP